MSAATHWEGVYQGKPPTEVTWYRPHLDQSLSLLARAALPRTAHVVDVGGGASTFVDDLLDRGFENVTVIDVAASALEVSKARLGARADQVRWIVGDATTPLVEPGSVDLWHDRAVCHFLTRDEDRAAYVEQVERAVRRGGYALIGTFALDGPERCSGLPVQRYDAIRIAAALGPSFTLTAEGAERHDTPRNTVQPFAYALCRRVG